jgi:hypothetical protein
MKTPMINKLLSLYQKEKENYPSIPNHYHLSFAFDIINEKNTEEFIAELQAINTTIDIKSPVSDTPIVGWKAMPKICILGVDLEVEVTEGEPLSSKHFCGRSNKGEWSHRWSINYFRFYKP